MFTERLRQIGEWAAFLSLGVLFAVGALTTVIGLAQGEAVSALPGLALMALVIAATVNTPYILMAVFNRAAIHGPRPVAQQARELHKSLFVADLHADTMMWRRDFLEKNRLGHIDLPRMREGNLALEVFTATTKAPVGMNFISTPDTFNMLTPLAVLQGWPRRTWGSLKERALYMAERLDGYAAASGGAFQVIRTREQLEHYVTSRETGSCRAAGVLGIQGAHCFEGRLENIDEMLRAGFRMVGLTHFFDNEVGGSAHGVRKGGLTDFGTAAVQRMEALEMIVDLAHAAPALIDDVLAMATRPVVASHTGPKGVYDTNRTISDAHIRTIAATGGLVGLGFWRDAVGPGGIDAIVRAVKYSVEVAGEDHVALGSDYDGMINAPFDSAALPLLTEALLNSGLPENVIRKVMGENVLRLLRACLPSA